MYGDNVCRGCKRFHFEVSLWIRYSEEERTVIIERIDAQLVDTYHQFFHIEDSAILKNECRKLGLEIDHNRVEASWLYVLLRASSSRIRSPQKYGFSLIQQAIQVSVAARYETWNKALDRVAAISLTTHQLTQPPVNQTLLF